MSVPIGPVEALKLALVKEKEAQDLYRRLGVEHKVASDVFDMLLSEEIKHQQLIEKKINELTA
jgi:rubrerythrin